MLVCSWREYEHVHSLSHPCDDGHACQRSSSGFLPSRSDFPGVTIYTNFNKNAHKGTIEIDTLGKLQFLYWQFEVINKNEKKYLRKLIIIYTCRKIWHVFYTWKYCHVVKFEFTRWQFIQKKILYLHMYCHPVNSKFSNLQIVFTGLIYKFCIYRVAVLNTINFVLTAIR